MVADGGTGAGEASGAAQDSEHTLWLNMEAEG
jgi:hypothetical protein